MKRFQVILIKPSRYDDDGYVISWFLGVLVSNSMAVINALTEQSDREKVLGPDVEIKTHFYGETVRRIPVKHLVQRNQFTRAVDLGKTPGIHSQFTGGYSV